MGYLRLVLLSLSIMLLGACTSKPNQDYDTHYNFSNLNRFSLLSPAEAGDSISGRRIEAAIVNSLTERGYLQAPQQAQFMVTYSIKVVDKPKRSSVSIGLGTGTWGSSGGISVGTSVAAPVGSDKKMQIIQIDIIDTASNKLIWRGSNNFDLDDGGEKKAMATQATVSTILAQFPPDTH